MPHSSFDWSKVTRPHVLATLKEYDDLGSKEFLRRYGFGRSPAYTLWHQGSEYDSTAVAGAAYFHATGAVTTRGELSGREDGAAKVLTDLGFDVVVDEQELPAKKPSRASKAPARKQVAVQKVPKVCPSCHMALPASGVCDFCD